MGDESSVSGPDGDGARRRGTADPGEGGTPTTVVDAGARSPGDGTLRDRGVR